MKKPDPADFNLNGTVAAMIPLNQYNYDRALLRYHEHWFNEMLAACRESAEHGIHGQPLNKAAEIVDVFFADPNIDPSNTP